MDLKPDTLLDLSNVLFHFKCYGTLDNETQAEWLTLRNGLVSKPMADVCQPIIRMGINQEMGQVYLNENDTLNLYQGVYSSGPAEPLTTFFEIHNLSVSWTDGNLTWGWFDDDTGLWNGVVAMVSFKFCC